MSISTGAKRRLSMASRRVVVPGPSLRRVPAKSRKRTAPVIVTVISDRARRHDLQTALIRRFGDDYLVRCLTSPQAAERVLHHLANGTREVALILADFQLPGMNGIDFLVQAHARHPESKRALLTTIGHHEAAKPIHHAMAMYDRPRHQLAMADTRGDPLPTRERGPWFVVAYPSAPIRARQDHRRAVGRTDS